ncbi:MAG TPA: hypothetical protein VGE45_21995 [Chloroflexia bacterium]|jgi:hypothetical protein
MMRKKITLALVLASALVMLAACDSGLQPTPIPTPTLAIQVTPSPDMKIVYQSSGGVAGSQTELVIGPTGETTLTERGTVVGTFDIGRDPVTELVKKFEAAKFFDLQDKYEKGDVVADDIYTTITYTQAGRTKTVTAAQVGGEGITPQSFLDLATQLNELASSLGGKDKSKP